ncbi:hypothetical protein OC844_004563 [Tilletia horrida]|nr:hypothetical protein OC844_004563 [Tilletia horrida]
MRLHLPHRTSSAAHANAPPAPATTAATTGDQQQQPLPLGMATTAASTTATSATTVTTTHAPSLLPPPAARQQQQQQQQPSSTAAAAAYSPLQPPVPLAALTLSPAVRLAASAPHSGPTSSVPSPRLPTSARLAYTPNHTTGPLTPASPLLEPPPPPPTPHLQQGPPFPMRSASHTVTETRRLKLQTHERSGRRMINQYIILQELGRGVHGQVRLALDKNSLRDDDEHDPHGRLVAVKIVERQPRKRLKIGGLGPSSSSKAVPRLDDGHAGGSDQAGSAGARSSQLRFDERSGHQRITDGEGAGDDRMGPPPPPRARGNTFLTTDAKVKREIAILKKLHHTNVVSLLEVIDDPDSKKIFMVLEYMAGGELHWRDESAPIPGSLEDRLNMPTPRPTLTISQIQGVMRDLVCGLQYLHYQGIIHRDIKPANLLWDEGKKTVKISDFGVSHFSATLQRVAQQAHVGSSAGNSANASAASSPPLECAPLFPELGGQHVAPFDGAGQYAGANANQGFLSVVSDEQELAKTAGSPAFFAPELCVAGDPSTSRSYLSLRHLSLSPSLGGAAAMLPPDVAAPPTTPLAMAPGRRPPITKAIDIWAVGVTLYCLCFGHPPFDAESEYALFSIIPNEDYEIPSWAGAPDRELAASLGLLPGQGGETEHQRFPNHRRSELRVGRESRDTVSTEDAARGAAGRKRSSSSGALLGSGSSQRASSSTSASTLLGKGKARQPSSSHPPTGGEADYLHHSSSGSGSASGGLAAPFSANQLPVRPAAVTRSTSSFSDIDEDARAACGRLRVGPRARRWGRRRVEEVASGWGSPWAARRWADEEADVHPESRRPSFSGAGSTGADGSAVGQVSTPPAPAPAPSGAVAPQSRGSSTGYSSGRGRTGTNVSAVSASSGPTSPERGGFKFGGGLSSFARPNPPHWTASPSNDGSWLPDYPAHLLSSEALQLLHLLDALLTKDPIKRITLDEVKIHPFLLGGFPVSPEAGAMGEEDVAREQALAAKEWLERTDVERHFEEVQVSGEDVERALTVGEVQGDVVPTAPNSAHPGNQGSMHSHEAFNDHDAGTPGASDVWLALAPLAGVAGVNAKNSGSVKSRSKLGGGGGWKTKLKEKLRKWGIRTPAPSQPGTRNPTPLATPVMTRVNSPVMARQDPIAAITTAATATATVAVAAASAAVTSLQQSLVLPSESGRFDDALEAEDVDADADPDPGADVVSLGGFPRSEPLQGSQTGMVAMVGSDYPGGPGGDGGSSSAGLGGRSPVVSGPQSPVYSPSGTGTPNPPSSHVVSSSATDVEASQSGSLASHGLWSPPPSSSAELHQQGGALKEVNVQRDQFGRVIRASHGPKDHHTALYLAGSKRTDSADLAHSDSLGPGLAFDPSQQQPQHHQAPQLAPLNFGDDDDGTAVGGDGSRDDGPETPGTGYDEEGDDDIDLHLDELSDDDMDDPAPERRSLAARSPDGGAAEMRADDRVLRNDGTGWKYDRSDAFGRPAEATIALARAQERAGTGSDALKDHLAGLPSGALSRSRSRSHGTEHGYGYGYDYGAGEHSHSGTLYSNGHTPGRHPSRSGKHQGQGRGRSSRSPSSSRSSGSFSDDAGAGAGTGGAMRQPSGQQAHQRWGDPYHRGDPHRRRHSQHLQHEEEEQGEESCDDDDEDGCVSFETRKVQHKMPLSAGAGGQHSLSQLSSSPLPPHARIEADAAPAL